MTRRKTNTNVERLFGSTLQTTEAWLSSLMKMLDTEDPERAYRIMRVTLHLLRDRLIPAEAVDLAAQLPMLLRGLYFEGWVPNDTPQTGTLETFLEDIRKRALDSDRDADPEAAARAVLRWLEEHISAGEISDVRYFFRDDLGSLWS